MVGGYFHDPCVGYAAKVDEVEALARAGADFVAIGRESGAARAALQRPCAVTERLAVPEPAR